MKIKHLLLAGLIAFCGVFGAIALSAQDVAAIKCPEGSLNKATEGSLKTLAECNLDMSSDNNKASAVSKRINTAINVVLGMVGVVSVVMIIIGGIQFVSSKGDAAKTTKARNTILYSVVGLVIALLAFAVVNFVLTGVFG